MVFSKGGVFAQLAEWCSVKSAFTTTAVENLGGLACTICRKMQFEATLWLNVAQKVWSLGNRYVLCATGIFPEESSVRVTPSRLPVLPAARTPAHLPLRSKSVLWRGSVAPLESSALRVSIYKEQDSSILVIPIYCQYGLEVCAH